MERLSNFLHEEGTNYAKFPELASYFALPYINGQTAISHPLLDVIRKVYTKTLLVGINIFWNQTNHNSIVLQEEWTNDLERQWIKLFNLSVHHFHGFDEERIEKKIKSHVRLKEKFIKLKEDHKLLLGYCTNNTDKWNILLTNNCFCTCAKSDLSTRLVTALEDALRGEAACDLETFEYYNQEIKNMSDNLQESRVSSIINLLFLLFDKEVCIHLVLFLFCRTQRDSNGRRALWKNPRLRKLLIRKLRLSSIFIISPLLCNIVISTISILVQK